MMQASPEMMKYFEEIKNGIDKAYEVARKARSKGLDPEPYVEIPIAGSMAERVEELVGPPGVAKVIKELLEKLKQKERVAFTVAEMIVEGKFGEEENKEKLAEQALRTALAILTEGVVVAPLEGIVEVKIKENSDRTNYLAIYYAGPIRAAGGTPAALSVLLADFIRRKLYLSPYKPTEQEVERYVEEVELYKTFVAPGQYVPSSEEIRKYVWNLPIEITGEATEEIEVFSFRNLPRVEHNGIRGGAILVLVEGVMQKSAKILKYVRELNLDGWEWLSEVVGSEKVEEAFRQPNQYLEETIGGRPVLALPRSSGARGGFRLRYGRSRTTGIAAVGIHPATMVICRDFIAIGTQLKTERPGKGGAATPVDSIEGPIVRLKDGSVVQLSSAEEARRVKNDIAEILFLGDILIGFGEFLENNHKLMPAGYCEEWWAQEVEKALGDVPEDLQRYIKPPYPRPSPQLAVELSEKHKIPLHPSYTYFYEDLDPGELFDLAKWLSSGIASFGPSGLEKLEVPMDEYCKRFLEEIGVPHKVENNKVIIEEHALPLCKTLGLLDGQNLTVERFTQIYQSTSPAESFDLISKLAPFPVRRKGGTFIGVRMGRPEKAKERMMKPPVHVLFPVGQEGGKERNIVEAEKVSTEIAIITCKKCGKRLIGRKCDFCGGEGEYKTGCPECGQTGEGRCTIHKKSSSPFAKITIDVRELLKKALEKIGEEKPSLLKGVQGLTSECKIPEPLEKGILRAKHRVFIFKDGTIRFDATNVPLTHFRPKEIGVSVEMLRKLGYEKDIYGNQLERDDQLLELKVQDLVISKKAADYLLRVSKFLDELLVKFYELEPFYNLKSQEDLVGHLVLALAPHTSVGVVGRIIGFVDANVYYAHPYFHAAKRRDCDGDEDCVMLLLDPLINFSRRFLPAGRGGRMDAPLVLNPFVDPEEVDKEVHNMDIMWRYPLEFYEATWEGKSLSEVLQFMETVAKRLGTEKQYERFGFTLDTSDIAGGPKESAYSVLETMEEKVKLQLELGKVIRSVDERTVAEIIVEHHFLRDMKGNMRTFGSQKVRCIVCNKKYRRIPLKGICDCGGKLVLTVSRGNIEKYMQMAWQIAKKYSVSEYTKQRLMLMKKEIESIFESDEIKQVSLADFL
ncbi:MAG: DNA polymerase II large subunit [Candidatus Hadarchaeales archaeon]